MAPLPQKQNGVFKKILKCYDYKQYKMGLKLAKQILGNPETANHGETLAMRGLILNCMGKKDEAHDYVRKGLRNDLTSHVCWHVYGLLQRSEHKYDEAIKCYRNALKYDPKNITILRDLSLLQIQMRDLEGFRDTRYQLFMLRSTQRVSWISFAVAYHLLNDHTTAAKILDEFRRTQKQQKEQKNSQADEDDSKKTSYSDPIDYEQSELLLYQVMILSEGGNYKEALDFLNKTSSQICDKLSILEWKSQLLIALGRNSEAINILQQNLISRNQENYAYYSQLEKALNIDPNDEMNRLKLYQNIQQKYPRSQIPFKIPLTFVNNPEQFRQIVDPYLRKSIRKCLPALFRNMRPVYKREYDDMVLKINQKYHETKQLPSSKSSDEPNIDEEQNLLYVESSNNNSTESRKTRIKVIEIHGIPKKIQIIQDLMLSYEKNIVAINSFDSDEATRDSENKTFVLWVYYYLAQHYDYLGQYDKALEYVKVAIEHTPTLIELLTLKGNIFKHMSEFDKAAELVSEAQRLDTADRYLNSKAAKYLLRANKLQQAEEMSSKFTRAGVSVNDNLNEMQCMWYHIETARAHHRLGEYGKALKRCYDIDAFFYEVTEDQFDFHTYCMRKMTLGSYIKLLRMEDVLRSHKFYFQAVELAIQIYLKLYDEPLVDSKENTNSSGTNAEMSAAELKKIRNKERKAAAKQQNQKLATSKSQTNDSDSTGKSCNKPKNDVANASSQNKQSQDASTNQKDVAATLYNQLEHPSDPLDKALRFLNPLKTLAMQRIDTHLLAFEVYKRKNKVLLMLQSVKRAQRLDQYHSKLRRQLKEFLDYVDSLKKSGDLSDIVVKVLDIELSKLDRN